MKQSITTDYLQELSDKGLEAYKAHLKDGYVNVIDYVLDKNAKPIDISKYTVEQLPLLSIGQLIEFLDAYCNQLEQNTFNDTGSTHLDLEGGFITHWTVSIMSEHPFQGFSKTANELVDALWLAVKEILEA